MKYTTHMWQTKGTFSVKSDSKYFWGGKSCCAVSASSCYIQKMREHHQLLQRKVQETAEAKHFHGGWENSFLFYTAEDCLKIWRTRYSISNNNLLLSPSPSYCLPSFLKFSIFSLFLQSRRIAFSLLSLLNPLKLPQLYKDMFFG